MLDRILELRRVRADMACDAGQHVGAGAGMDHPSMTTMAEALATVAVKPPGPWPRAGILTGQQSTAATIRIHHDSAVGRGRPSALGIAGPQRRTVPAGDEAGR